MNVRSFFDLSQPVGFREKPKARKTADAPVGAPAPTAAPAVGTVTEIPPAGSVVVPGTALSSSPSGSQELSWAWQVAIYFVLVLSILSSRFLDLYRAGVLSEFTVDGPYLLFIAIASLLAFPIVYARAELNRNRPMLLQIALVFAAGMGWEKIVATAIGR